MKPRVLIIEDEPSITENIVYALETEGFETVACTTGEDGLAEFEADDFSLIILDVGLPDTTGFELCKKIRLTSTLPIIFLTARSAELDRVVGLEIGADDYVTKPFSPRELAARVKAVLRRFSPSAPSSPQSNKRFVIDEDRMQIQFLGTALDLSATEFRLLRTLCKHPGRVYSRTQLMEHAWDEPGFALERTVDAHVKAIRAKLRAVAVDQDPIITHRGMGYSLKEQS